MYIIIDYSHMSRYFLKEGNEHEGLQARSLFVNKQSVSTWFGDRGIRLPFDAMMFGVYVVLKRSSIVDIVDSLRTSCNLYSKSSNFANLFNLLNLASNFMVLWLSDDSKSRSMTQPTRMNQWAILNSDYWVQRHWSTHWPSVLHLFLCVLA